MEPQTYEALRIVVNDFEQDLEQARLELRRLEEAVGERDTLHVLMEEYRAHIHEHEALLEKQHRRLERLEPEGSYRNLHRAYGATITERRIVRQKYQRTTQNVQAVVRGTVARSRSERSLVRHYMVTPIGYPEREVTRTLTIEQALQGL